MIKPYVWEDKSETRRWSELRLSSDEVRHCPFGMKEPTEPCHNGAHVMTHTDRIHYDGGGSYSPIEVCSKCHHEYKDDGIY